MATRYAQRGPIYEHREVAERVLGRPLTSKEVVHHIDNDSRNNDPSNLVICPDQAYHKLLHARQDAIEAGVSYDTHARCAYHNAWEPIEAFSTWRSKAGRPNGRCLEGTNAYRKEKGIKSEWNETRAAQQRARRSLST